MQQLDIFSGVTGIIAALGGGSALTAYLLGSKKQDNVDFQTLLQAYKDITETLKKQGIEKDKIINNQAKEINNQAKEINSQAKEINNQAKEINNQNKIINSQAEEINSQAKEINSQDKTINNLQKQKNYLRKLLIEKGFKKEVEKIEKNVNVN